MTNQIADWTMLMNIPCWHVRSLGVRCTSSYSVQSFIQSMQNGSGLAGEHFNTLDELTTAEQRATTIATINSDSGSRRPPWDRMMYQKLALTIISSQSNEEWQPTWKRARKTTRNYWNGDEEAKGSPCWRNTSRASPPRRPTNGRNSSNPWGM